MDIYEYSSDSEPFTDHWLLLRDCIWNNYITSESKSGNLSKLSKSSPAVKMFWKMTFGSFDPLFLMSLWFHLPISSLIKYNMMFIFPIWSPLKSKSTTEPSMLYTTLWLTNGCHMSTPRPVISQAYLCFNKAKKTFQKWDFGCIIQRHFLNRRTDCWSYLSEYLLKETK